MMEVVSLPGLTPYARAHDLQRELLEQRIRDEIPDTVIFLEHEPVITRGRGLQWSGEQRDRSVPLRTDLPAGVAYAEIERGGDLTYHGPGQLVVYPIVKLGTSAKFPKADIMLYLRELERIGVDELKRLGLAQARGVENASGIWVGDRKIASLGIAVRKWVTYHGLAINLSTDLAAFNLIDPCGYSPEVMTRLKDQDVSHEAQTRAHWERVFRTGLSSSISVV